MDKGSLMQVKIYAPFKTYFDGVASSVSAANQTGPFDVLPKHKNFMTLLSECDIVVRAPNQPEVKFPVTKGVMHVKADKATVFLDI